MEDQIFTSLSTLMGLVGLVYLIFWRYKAYRVDAFRQELFELRDQLFDFADSGEISFNHPAYGLLRSTINGFIRFGHRCSLWGFVLYNLFYDIKQIPDREDSFQAKWERATADLAPDTKKKMGELRAKMEVISVKHLIAKDVELYPVVLLLAIILSLKLTTKAISALFSHGSQSLNGWPRMKNNFDALDNTALGYGTSTDLNFN